MMNSLQERVASLLSTRGLTQAEASRRGGFNNNAFINDILRGHKKSVRGPNLVKLAKALETTESYLLFQTEDSSRPADGEAKGARPQIDIVRAGAVSEYREAPEAPEIDRGTFPRDVPVRGVVVCGDDADFALNGQTGDYVRRPPGIEGKRSVYALHIVGESMWPVYRHGALVYVDPKRTPGVGEDAVIELHPEDPNSGEPGKGYVKRVKRAGPTKIVVEQFNPPKDIEFDREDIKGFHRVIPLEELLGY